MEEIELVQKIFQVIISNVLAHYGNLSDISIKVIPDTKLVQHFGGWCLGGAVCFERKCQQRSWSLVWGGDSWSYL